MPDAPRTADGVEIVPGMDIWRPGAGGTLHVNVVAWLHPVRVFVVDGGCHGHRPEEYYAKRENAEAARKAARKAKGK